MRLWRRKRAPEDDTAAEEAAEVVIGETTPEEAEEIHAQTERAVERTKRGFFGRIGGMFQRADFGDELWDDLEEVLLGADTGLPTTEAILERVRDRVRSEGVRSGDEVREVLREELIAVLDAPGRPQLPWERDDAPEPIVVLVVGVNGAGKTTTIGKMAHAFRQDGATVILAAGDTFRAAAIDQLRIWGERAGVRVVAGQPGSDPGSVVYDAVSAAESGAADIVIVDTAGRLHTKFNLMEELRKVSRVSARIVPDSPHATLLVLDATTGQNGLAQARSFTEATGVTGIVLAKLDGTSKGGIVFSIAHDLGLPVVYIGTGERLDDLAPFSPHDFVDTLLS